MIKGNVEGILVYGLLVSIPWSVPPGVALRYRHDDGGRRIRGVCFVLFVHDGTSYLPG